MMELTKERLTALSNRENVGAICSDEIVAMARQLLAGLEPEPVAYIAKYESGAIHGTCDRDDPVKMEWLKRDMVVLSLYAAPQLPQPAVDEIGEIRVGRLPTMNQDEYPGLGDWWVQLRIGDDADEVLARVYGATPQEANNRAVALARRAAMLQGSK